MEQNLAAHIIEADGIFKKNGATQPTVTEMLPGITNTVDSHKLAKTTDIVGISLFGKATRQTALFMAASASLAKAENKSSFVIEAGGGSIKFDNPAGYAPQAFTPSAEELKTTVLMRAGFGTRGVMFWCWRPRLSDMEGNDFGMCRPDGKPLKRTVELPRRGSFRSVSSACRWPRDRSSARRGDGRKDRPSRQREWHLRARYR